MQEGQLLLGFEPRRIYLGDDTSDYDSEKGSDEAKDYKYNAVSSEDEFVKIKRLEENQAK